MITVDGSRGGGGGQILRTSLSLSICTQQPFRIANIRINRDRPGLMRQHLTAVKSAAEICGADVSGAEVGSRELTFSPGRLRAGAYEFSIGTAGSTTLVLQTVLPPLLTAHDPSTVRIAGGTHNRGSPPFEFVERAFLPMVSRMGANVQLQLISHGFYPRGGGEIRATVSPARLRPISLHARGAHLRTYAEAYVSALPMHIAERELAFVGRSLNLGDESLVLCALPNDIGPGNAVMITIAHENATEVCTGFGERGVRAETVAAHASREASNYLASAAPIGEHLADQLLLPMALAGGGSFTATAATQHLHSNAFVIERFTDRRVAIEDIGVGSRVEIR